MDMKKIFRRLWKTLLGMVLFMGLTTGCAVLTSEGDFSTEAIIAAEHVPAETYYADLLVQLPQNDRLRTADTGVRLDGAEISENSEIFRYDTDNYVSASLHYGYAEQISFPEHPNENLLETDIRFSGNTKDGRFSRGKYFTQIPSFRIAYVSQDGRVLGVTDPAEKRTHMLDLRGVSFRTDGKAAHYDIVMGDDWNTAATVLAVEMVLLFIFVIIAVPVYAIAGAVSWRRSRKAMIAEIEQHAAQDHDSGEQP